MVPASMLHQEVNIANTMKVAVDFVSPFNAPEMTKNVERIYREKNKEDYRYEWRSFNVTKIKVECNGFKFIHVITS